MDPAAALVIVFRTQYICKLKSNVLTDLLLNAFKPGFHSQQTARPRHKKQSDYVVEQSLVALFCLKIGLCRVRNWLYGHQAL